MSQILPVEKSLYSAQRGSTEISTMKPIRSNSIMLCHRPDSMSSVELQMKSLEDHMSMENFLE